MGGDWWSGVERNPVTFAEDSKDPSLHSNHDPASQIVSKATPNWNPGHARVYFLRNLPDVLGREEEVWEQVSAAGALLAGEQELYNQLQGTIWQIGEKIDFLKLCIFNP